MGKDSILMLLIKQLIEVVLIVEFDLYLVLDIEVNCKNGLFRKMVKIFIGMFEFVMFCDCNGIFEF